MDGVSEKQIAEEIFIQTAQEAGDVIYERFVAGEITQEDLAVAYTRLRQWTIETERLLSLLK